MNKNKSDEIESLTRIHNENIKLNNEKLLQQNIIDIEYITNTLNNTISIEQTKNSDRKSTFKCTHCTRL